MQRHIGIDLHRNRFTCCVRLENGRNYLSDWMLEDLPRFLKKLRPSDALVLCLKAKVPFYIVERLLAEAQVDEKR